MSDKILSREEIEILLKDGHPSLGACAVIRLHDAAQREAMDSMTAERGRYAKLYDESADIITGLHVERDQWKARFDWWFTLAIDGFDLDRYMTGIREGWDAERWRSEIDNAMAEQSQEPQS